MKARGVHSLTCSMRWKIKNDSQFASCGGSLQRWMCGCAQELPGLCCFEERVERVQESMLQDSRQLIQDDVQASRALVKIEIRREEESATETDA
jgi:hypothetical protein